MISLEEAFVVSGERVADCRDELVSDFAELISRGETNGFSRKEILVALSSLTTQQLSVLPDAPRLH